MESSASALSTFQNHHDCNTSFPNAFFIPAGLPAWCIFGMTSPSAPKSVPAYPNCGVCSVGDLFSDLSLARMSACRYPSNRGIDRLLN